MLNIVFTNRSSLSKCVVTANLENSPNYVDTHIPRWISRWSYFPRSLAPALGPSRREADGCRQEAMTLMLPKGQDF